MTLTFGYGTTDNNGNVVQQEISRPGVLTATQHYRYDGVNRLAIAAENAQPAAGDGCPAGAVWCRDYSYDAYGNRAIIDDPGAAASQFAPTALSQFSALTNRIASVPGAATPVYDNAGNLVSHAGVGVNLAYDANNKMTSFTGTSPTLQQQGGYVYDGDGRRVQRQSTIAGTSITTTYVYDAFGNLAAEYSTQATETPDTYYRTTDHLGSTRLVTRANGTVKKCLDFLPFGEPLDDSTANRNQSCYGNPDEGPFKQKFTGKERDGESSLDYFGARYFGSNLGRFTSPDAPFADQFAENPQSWSLYSYVRNNPLTFTDPTGTSCQHGASACLDYFIGAAKTIGNLPTDLLNTPTHIVNLAISPFTDYQFAPLVPAEYQFQPANINQGEGMEAAGVVLMLTPLAELEIAPAAAASARTSAVATADAAQAAGATRGTAAALRVGGETFTDVSTGAPGRKVGTLNPRVQSSLDRIPMNQRSQYHGACAEPSCISQALDAGVNPSSGQMSTAKIRAPGRPQHGAPNPPCSTCEVLLDEYGIKRRN